jgi:hypothetical protein
MKYEIALHLDWLKSFQSYRNNIGLKIAKTLEKDNYRHKKCNCMHTATDNYYKELQRTVIKKRRKK